LAAKAILDAFFSGWENDFDGTLESLVFDYESPADFLTRFFEVKVNKGGAAGIWLALEDGLILDADLSDGDANNYVISFRASDLLPFYSEMPVLTFEAKLLLK